MSRARAALDHDGAVIGYASESKAFSHIDTNESSPIYSLASQLMGLPLNSLQGFGIPAESYGSREQAAGLTDDRRIARPRLAVADRACARWCSPQIQSVIPSSAKSSQRSAPTRWCSTCAI
jgi:hypothetical protein